MDYETLSSVAEFLNNAQDLVNTYPVTSFVTGYLSFAAATVGGIFYAIDRTPVHKDETCSEIVDFSPRDKRRIKNNKIPKFDGIF